MEQFQVAVLKHFILKYACNCATIFLLNQLLSNVATWIQIAARNCACMLSLILAPSSPKPNCHKAVKSLSPAQRALHILKAAPSSGTRSHVKYLQMAKPSLMYALQYLSAGPKTGRSPDLHWDDDLAGCGGGCDTSHFPATSEGSF